MIETADRANLRVEYSINPGYKPKLIEETDANFHPNI